MTRASGRKPFRSPTTCARETVIDIQFRIMGHNGALGPQHPLWHTPLPSMAQKVPPAPDATEGPPASITYGAYFAALQSYVQGPGRAHIQRALSARRPEAAVPRSPDRITLTLEKHGEFYHPARLSVGVQGEVVALALNVAVTATGRACLASELAALKRVAQRLPAGCLPVVYGAAAVPGPGHIFLEVFLADWFEDFYEFHLSIDPHGHQGMILWDTRSAPYFLTEDQQAEVYRQTAYLLTRAYDPVSTAQIYPWHHASGDFVLRIDGNAVNLRLITVRQYAPTLTGDPHALDDEARLMALLVYFLNLTLRNRIDRLDGTGELAWAAPLAVKATLAGVHDALEEDMRDTLNGLLSTYEVSECVQLLKMVAARYCLMPREQDLLEPLLAPHAELLLDLLRRR